MQHALMQLLLPSSWAAEMERRYYESHQDSVLSSEELEDDIHTTTNHDRIFDDDAGGDFMNVHPLGAQRVRFTPISTQGVDRIYELDAPRLSRDLEAGFRDDSDSDEDTSSQGYLQRRVVVR